MDSSAVVVWGKKEIEVDIGEPRNSLEHRRVKIGSESASHRAAAVAVSTLVFAA
jgi:hypothetical protein